MKTFKSNLSNIEYPISQKVDASSLKEEIVNFIKKDNPGFNEHHCLSLSELQSYRQKYIIDYLIKQTGEITDLEQTVIDSMAGDTILADTIEDADKKPLTRGQMLADKVAGFGGSWIFIISFVGFLLLWIGVNVFVLAKKAFDPYPFILLNLLLSCIAALQAPVIMMSQNRQEEKDRDRAKKDYMINLKSELEIKSLHDKLDRLMAIHKLMELPENSSNVQ